jgi:predicted MFS family arabinose efflux permease
VSYRAVLALPHARGLLAASILPRLAYGLAGLPLLVAVRASTGSYAAAGAAISVYALGAALLGPARARLIQRHPSAFLLLGACYAFLLAALAVTSAVRIPAAATAVAVALAAAAGLVPPPVGPRMRARWASLAPDDALRQRALSLDTATESTAFALGPALAGTLIAATSAPVVLGVCAVLSVGGFVPLAVVLRAHHQAAPAPEKEGGDKGERAATCGIKGLLLVTGAIAAAAAIGDTSVLAAWGPLAAGLLTALFPVGGVLGGLAYGRRQWRGPLARRPFLLTAASALCYALPVLAYAPAGAAAALLVAGACCDILAVTTYQLVSVRVAASRQAEAGAWLNAAFNLGAAAGSAGGGVLAALAGPRGSFAVAAGLCAATAACVTLASLRAPIRRRG